MHFKDYSAGECYLGYCPLCEGKANFLAIYDLIDGLRGLRSLSCG